MTNEELITYFISKELPEVLRIDRASTQHEVKEAVQRNIETLKADPNDIRAKHRLTQIMNALEIPYSGQEIPRL
jgi:ribosome recycling factor